MQSSKFNTICFNFDESITHQKDLLPKINTVLDFTKIGNSLRLFCSKNVIEQFKINIRQLYTTLPKPWLTFIGSGDFHHISLALLEELPQSPTVLILIDNHPDWFYPIPKYHCGNWLSSTLSIQGLEHIAVIGPNSNDLIGRQFITAPIDAIGSNRITLYPAKSLKVNIPIRWPHTIHNNSSLQKYWWGTQFSCQGLESGATQIFQQIAAQHRGKNIYISIDKDALTRDYAFCDWEQGIMTLDDLCEGIKVLKNNCTIIGADICGDASPLPLTGFVKRFDAQRASGSEQLVNEKFFTLNAQANLSILEALSST